MIITWGPGEGSTTLTLAAGVSAFSATHQYLDDNPTGTVSDLYPIVVTVTDNHNASGNAATSIDGQQRRPDGHQPDSREFNQRERHLHPERDLPRPGHPGHAHRR